MAKQVTHTIFIGKTQSVWEVYIEMNVN